MTTPSSSSPSSSRRVSIVLGVVLGLASSHCGRGAPSRTGDLTASPCQTNADCGAGSVCLAIGNTSGCVVQCSATANECGGSASCAGVGAASINVCQPAPDPQKPPKPDEQPRLPCRSDAECAAVAPGTICVEFKGVRDCTIPCAQESNCDLPSVPGISIDFLTCAADGANPARRACVPDEKCFTNPTSCFSITTPGGPGSSDGGCRGPASTCAASGECCSGSCMFGFCE